MTASQPDTEPQQWRPDWTPEDRAEIEKIKAERRRSKPIVRRLRHELSQAEAAGRARGGAG